MTFKAAPSRFLITIQRPALWIFSAFVLLSLLTGAFIAMYYLGVHSNHPTDQPLVSSEPTDIEQQVRYLQTERAKLQQAYTKLERESHILQQASQEITKSLQDKNNELLKLREELTFYRNLVSPGQTKRTVTLQPPQVTYQQTSDRYSFKFVLIQKGLQDRHATGSFQFWIEGQRNGETIRLSQAELMQPTQETFSLKFKYFQRIEGKIHMPAMFTPTALHIKASLKGKDLKDIENTFPWESIISRGETSNVQAQE